MNKKNYLLLALLFIFNLSTNKAEASQKENITETIIIDKMYASMMGPYTKLDVQLLENVEKEELLWITSAEAEVISSKTKEGLSQEYFCHSNLGFEETLFDFNKRNALFGHTTHLRSRLFTLIQGQTKIELPKNFGIPILSSEVLSFDSMVVNNNPLDKPLSIQVKATFDFTRDKDVINDIKPLFLSGASLMVPIVNPKENKPSQKMKSCCGAPLARSVSKNLKDWSIKKNDHEQLESSHWYVPPGRHTYRYQFSGPLLTSFATKAHYISVHLHAYGESLELKDLTANKTIFKSYAKNYEDRVGIQYLDHYSSSKGIPIYPDHEYELIAIYNNTTDKDIDAMAMVYTYMWDKYFDLNKIDLNNSKGML